MMQVEKATHSAILNDPSEEETIPTGNIEATRNFSGIIGEGPEMNRIFELIQLVAPSESTVVILGETGTGKELIARAIHNNSPRKDKMMVKVNCAALPAHLIESELFGHERGAFTGATDRRLGKFELANRGTLFLDEIGEMPLDLQVKLLRALQEKEIERIGGMATIKVDIRIIVATNRDLEKEVSEGRFRSDLYYRLNTFPITLPALRQRREDIPLLADYFIRRFSKKANKNINRLSNAALQDLLQYAWPGNVRELEHVIERSILFSTAGTLKQIYLPEAKVTLRKLNLSDVYIPRTMDEQERDHILRTLDYCNGKIAGTAGAAAILDLPPTTLHSKMRRLGISKAHIGVESSSN
jgi:transcriptional regulator with GAF, ATPase, and Fis domain